MATADLELLLPPDPGVLRAALAALADAGFALEAGGAPFLELDDDLVLGRLIERGANRAALSPDGARIDLMLSIKGFRFDELAGDAGRFRLGGVEVRVARLGKLLRAKELSDRAKDREFLRLYAARLRGEAGGSD